MWPCSCELIKTIQHGCSLKAMALNQSFFFFKCFFCRSIGNKLITAVKFFFIAFCRGLLVSLHYLNVCFMDLGD